MSASRLPPAPPGLMPNTLLDDVRQLPVNCREFADACYQARVARGAFTEPREKLEKVESALADVFMPTRVEAEFCRDCLVAARERPVNASTVSLYRVMFPSTE